MERSLSVLLPVRNVQSTLAATVQEILEVVSELTGRFELVIVDDGSADATSEVAQELTRCFPQVRAVFHGRPLGRETAIRTGLRQSSGEIIFLRDEASGLGMDEIRRLWRAATQGVLAADDTNAPAGPRGSRWTSRHPGHQAGYQMFDRRAIEQMHGWSKPTRPNYLLRLKDFALGE